MKSLTFDDLRAANLARLPQFKNKRGEPAHSRPDGFDWSAAQWLQAVIGELGEYANLVKKVERGDLDINAALPDLADELADVQTYLDLLAHRLGIDLGLATIDKWNRVSVRVGCDVRLGSADQPAYQPPAWYTGDGDPHCPACKGSGWWNRCLPQRCKCAPLLNTNFGVGFIAAVEDLPEPPRT